MINHQFILKHISFDIPFPRWDPTEGVVTHRLKKLGLKQTAYSNYDGIHISSIQKAVTFKKLFFVNTPSLKTF